MAPLLASSCRQETPPASVEGTLRLKGKPLDNCLITFLPEPGQASPGPHSAGVTDDRGRYHLRWADQRIGASVGWHRTVLEDLSVSTGVRRRDDGTIDQETDETPRAPARRSRVPPTYRFPETTPLKERIQAGEQVIHIDIP